jgi:hypothetical protein
MVKELGWFQNQTRSEMNEKLNGASVNLEQPFGTFRGATNARDRGEKSGTRLL